MSEWKTVRLGDVCEQIRGVSYKPADLHNDLDDNSVTLLRANNIFEDVLNYDDLVYVDNKKVSNFQYLKRGDILICASSGSRNLVGKAACLEEDRKLTFGAFCKVLRTDTINHGFFKHYFFSPTYRLTISNLSAGANINNIRAEDLDNLQIPLPPLETQKQIAAVLDKCTSLISKYKKMLKKYDTLIKSRFIEMFGDPSKNNKKWEIKKLGDIIRVLGGYAFSSKAFKESGIPVLRIGNINSGVFRPTNMVFWDDDEKIERYAIYPSDLVMSLTGTVGKDDYGNVCILGNDYPKYYLNQRNAKLEIISDLERLYLSYLLKFPEIKSRLTNISRGIRQANIANKDIENLQIPVPPLSLQNQFAAFVQQIDKSKFEIEKILKIMYN